MGTMQPQQSCSRLGHFFFPNLKAVQVPSVQLSKGARHTNHQHTIKLVITGSMVLMETEWRKRAINGLEEIVRASSEGWARNQTDSLHGGLKDFKGDPAFASPVENLLPNLVGFTTELEFGGAGSGLSLCLSFRGCGG